MTAKSVQDVLREGLARLDYEPFQVVKDSLLIAIYNADVLPFDFSTRQYRQIETSQEMRKWINSKLPNEVEMAETMTPIEDELTPISNDLTLLCQNLNQYIDNLRKGIGKSGGGMPSMNLDDTWDLFSNIMARLSIELDKAK
jgi:hypothetical protein